MVFMGGVMIFMREPDHPGMLWMVTCAGMLWMVTCAGMLWMVTCAGMLWY
jgi:inorganic pyrophosphatase